MAMNPCVYSSKVGLGVIQLDKFLKLLNNKLIFIDLENSVVIKGCICR